MTIIKALRFHGRKDVRVDNVTTLSCAPDEVRVQIAYCGICGSDVHEYLGGPIFAPEPGQRNPHTGVELPVTMGHEMSGTIVEVGSATNTQLNLGQNVAINPSIGDRHHGKDLCVNCQSGRPNICSSWACYGLNANGGGFAEEIVVKSFSCIPIPDGVSLKVGALAEPLAVASHMIRISGFQEGHSAVVLGAGPIGLALLLLLKARGADKVIVSEVTHSRARQAKDFGADMVVNPLQTISQQRQNGSSGSERPTTNPVLEAVRSLMADGADIAFDATGIQSTLDTAISAVKPGGTIFNVAIHEKPLLLNLNDLAFTEKKLMGGICYTNEDFEAVLSALATGIIPAEDMITSVVPLDKVVEGGFLELINNKTRHVKILIQPSQSTVQ